MQAIIMAGGQGTRLKELTADLIPKPMIEICGKPLLQWQIENLRSNGINDIIIIVGHLGEQIINKFEDVRYYKEDKPLGTAGILPQLEDILKDDFFLIYGDLFFDIDLQRMMEFHRNHQARGTAFVHPNSHPYDSNLVVVDNNYRIKEIMPKGKSLPWWMHNLTNAGIYIFNKKILEVFPATGKVDLEQDILPKIRYFYAYRSTEYVKDIGTTARFYQTENDIKNQIPEHRSLKNKQKAIFLDRDGTINYKNDLISNPIKFELFPYAAEAIRKINKSKYLAIVITNQPVVARGLCSLKMLDAIHAKMEEQLGNSEAYLDDIFFCPHHPDKGYPEENPKYKINCDCRKPKPGMIFTAAEKYNIDLSQSWMIGDTQIDYETAINAGVKPLIVGKDTENLLTAVRRILNE